MAIPSPNQLHDGTPVKVMVQPLALALLIFNNPSITLNQYVARRSMQAEQQVGAMTELKPAGDIGTPSLLKIIVEKAVEMGVERSLPT
jgi:hypothetical protein